MWCCSFLYPSPLFSFSSSFLLELLWHSCGSWLLFCSHAVFTGQCGSSPLCLSAVLIYCTNYNHVSEDYVYMLLTAPLFVIFFAILFSSFLFSIFAPVLGELKGEMWRIEENLLRETMKAKSVSSISHNISSSFHFLLLLLLLLLLFLLFF